MDELHISKLPDLEHAVLVGAFAGWNDAASAASWAVKFLVNHWDATQFADIDSDGFYDFTETRPTVRVASGSVRQFTWPSTRFYYYRAPREDNVAAGRDVVLVLGEEPQLRWKAFSRAVVEVCRKCHVEDVVLLGALVAEVPHTIPVQISGVSNVMPTLRQMGRLDVELASYEGPTGILSALQEASRKEGLATMSLWGAAPYYVSATPNLPVAEALLRKVEALYGFGLRLGELSKAARRFNQRVSSLVAEDSDVSAYVHELERRLAQPDTDDADGDEPSEDSSDHSGVVDADPPELPTPEEAIQDVEAWLRRFREQSGTD
jgi:predicted ATP-grasp superfamily ATP-dependent carboligase